MSVRQSVFLCFVLSVAMAISSCGDDETTCICPPPPEDGVITMTVETDTCFVFPLSSEGTLEGLCDTTFLLTISFKDVCPDQLNEVFIEDIHIQTRHVPTGDTEWECDNTGVADDLFPLFSGLPVTVSANRAVGPDYDSRQMMVSVGWSSGGESYKMSVAGPYEMLVDEDGYPLVENNTSWSGSFYFEHYLNSSLPEFELVRGSAEVSVKNMTAVPVDTTTVESN